MKEMGITFEVHLGTRWFFLQINYIILSDKSLKSKIGRKWPEQCHFLNWNLNYLFWESYHTNVRRLAEVTRGDIKVGRMRWHFHIVKWLIPGVRSADTPTRCRSSPPLLCHLDDRNLCRNLVLLDFGAYSLLFHFQSRVLTSAHYLLVGEQSAG